MSDRHDDDSVEPIGNDGPPRRESDVVENAENAEIAKNDHINPAPALFGDEHDVAGDVVDAVDDDWSALDGKRETAGPTSVARPSSTDLSGSRENLSSEDLSREDLAHQGLPHDVLPHEDLTVRGGVLSSIDALSSERDEPQLDAKRGRDGYADNGDAPQGGEDDEYADDDYEDDDDYADDEYADDEYVNDDDEDDDQENGEEDDHSDASQNATNSSEQRSRQPLLPAALAVGRDRRRPVAHRDDLVSPSHDDEDFDDDEDDDDEDDDDQRNNNDDRVLHGWFSGKIPRALTIAGLGVLLGLVVQLLVVKPTMERRLRQRVQKVLQLNGDKAIRVSAVGRTVKLSGFSPSAEARKKTIALVKGRPGVDDVDGSKLEVNQEAAAIPLPTDVPVVAGGTSVPAVPETTALNLAAVERAKPMRKAQVDVSVKNKTLTINGSVPNEEAKALLLGRTTVALGDAAVFANLTIPAESTERADQNDYRRVGLFLGIVATTPDASVDIKYDRGTLKLSGTVADADQLALIRREAAKLVVDPALLEDGLSIGAQGSVGTDVSSTTGSPTSTTKVVGAAAIGDSETSTTAGATTTTKALVTTTTKASVTTTTKVGVTTTAKGGVTTSAGVTTTTVPGAEPAAAAIGNTAAPAAQAASQVVNATINGRVIAFENNRARLTNAGRQVVIELAKTIAEQNDPNLRFEIAGFTDAKGRDVDNLDLSKRRAEAILEVLSLRGVARDKMVATGYGEASPIADNETEEGRAKNRRIEIRVGTVG